MRFSVFSRAFHCGSTLEAGHSKWANIRHIKAAKDGQKAVEFAKYSRQIRLAIQGNCISILSPNLLGYSSNFCITLLEGKSTNPALNSQLKSVIEIAVKNSMPNSKITDVIKKYNKSDAELKRVPLEIKVLNKIYVVAVVFTDNLTYAKNQISTILRKSNSAFAESKKLFDEKGLVEVLAPAAGEGDLLEQATDVAIECGAEDVEVIDEKERRLIFVCHPQSIYAVGKKVTDMGYSIENTDFTFIPKSTVQTSEFDRDSYKVFYDKLKAYDGIEHIFHNMEAFEEEEGVDGQ